MNYAKALYHRIIPARIRNPIGLFRRDVIDRLQRALSRVPIPPRDLIADSQKTPWSFEYLGAGKRSARLIMKQLELSGVSSSSAARVLDFGCGSGRILRYLKNSAWELHGCDPDRQTITWSRKALSFARFESCSLTPPLPYDDRSFDVVISLSLHGPEEQQIWRDEMARILRPQGLLVSSTNGMPAVIVETLSPQFLLIRWFQHSLDGSQDLSILRRL